MTDTPWARYVAAKAGRDTDVTIAKNLSLSPSTVGRWKSGEVEPKPRQVVAFARAYAQSPISALIAAGYLDESDLEGDIKVLVAVDLDDVSTDALIAELQARIENMGDYANWIHSIVRGESSPTGLSASALRYIDPNRPPSQVRGEDFIEVLGDGVTPTDVVYGQQIYNVAAQDVDGSRQDYGLVANDSIDENPIETDADFDNA